MPVNETVVEVVRFTEKGISEIDARTKAMGQSIDEAARKQKVMLGVLNDPRYAKHQQRLTVMQQQSQLIALRARNVAAAAGLADGSTARWMRSTAKLNDQFEKLQRHAALTARYGDRIGGFLARYGGSMSRIGGMVGVGLSGIAVAGVGLARQGFQGTVEQARFDAEHTQLAREMAGVFKPVSDLATRMMRSAREQLSRTGEGGQNALLAGTAVAGTAAGVMALRGAAQLIGAVAGDTMATRFRGMALRGGIGFSGAALAGYGVATNNTPVGALGGAMLGFSVAGPLGALAGGAIGAAASAPGVRPDEKPFEYYERMRREGSSVVGAGLDVGGAALGKLWTGILGDRDEAARRTVTMAGGGFEATGSAYDRLSAGIEKVEGADTGGGGGMWGGMAAAMRELTEEIRRARAGGAPLARPGEPGF